MTGPGPEATSSRSQLITAVFWVLALYGLAVALWIEVLNSEAGGYMPAPRSAGKWRVGATTEDYWRRFYGAQGRPLSEPERAMIQARITQERANGRLRSIVSTFGLFQYPVLLFTLCGTLYFTFVRMRISIVPATLILVSTIVAGALLGYRDYIGSLGW